MLSEEYFGFRNNNIGVKKSKKFRRTQLSQQRARQGADMILHENQGDPLQKLRNKYNAIQQNKIREKKLKKSRTHSHTINRICFNSLKFKNLHYNESGQVDRYCKIRKQLQKKVLETARKKINSPSVQKKILNHNGERQPGNKYSMGIHIPNLLGNQKTKGRYQQDFSMSSLHKIGDQLKSNKQKQLFVSNVIKINSPADQKQHNERSNYYQIQKQNQCINNDRNNPISYILGTETIRKQEKYNKIIFQVTQKNKEQGYGIESKQHKLQSFKQSAILNSNSSLMNPNIHNKDYQLVIPQYKRDQINSDSSEVKKLSSEGISDYEKIKLMEQRRKEQVVKILNQQGQYSQENSESRFKTVQNSNIYHSFADIKEIKVNQDYMSQNSKQQLKAYNNSRIIYNQSNLSANLSSLCQKEYHIDKGRNLQKIINQKKPPQQAKQLQVPIKNQESQSQRFLNLSNHHSTLSDIIESSDKLKIKGASQNEIHQTGAFKKITTTSKQIKIHDTHKQSSQLSQIIKIGGGGEQSQLGSLGCINFQKQQKNQSTCRRKYMQSFNLVESIRFLNNLEEQKIFSHNSNSIRESFNKNIREESSCSEDQVYECILEHLARINQIGEFVQMKDEVYDSQYGNIYDLQSFLLFKKFQQERIKIVKSIRQGSSIFNLSGSTISTKNLIRYRNRPKIIQLSNKILQCNQIVKKTLNQYHGQQLKNYPQNPLINYNPLSRKDIGLLLAYMNQQLQALMEKYSQNINNKNDPQNSNNEISIICIRASCLMEIGFLISELDGKKYKDLSEQISSEEFASYYKTYIADFQKIQKYYQ